MRKFKIKIEEEYILVSELKVIPDFNSKLLDKWIITVTNNPDIYWEDMGGHLRYNSPTAIYELERSNLTTYKLYLIKPHQVLVENI